MPRRFYVPDFSKKVLLAAARLALPQDWEPLCNEINIKRRTLVDAVNGTATTRSDHPTPGLLDQLAKALGFDWHWTEFYDRDKQGRDSLDAFKLKIEKDGQQPIRLVSSSQISPELLRALRSSPDTAILATNRGTASAIAAQFASVTTFVDQSDIRRLSLEVSGHPWTLTISDDKGRPILHRKIVLLRGQIEMHLGGAEIVGGLTALKQVVAAYSRNPEARGVLLNVSGSATAPIIEFEVQRACLGVLRPGFNPTFDDGTSEDDEADDLLCLLANIQAGTKISVFIRAFHKDFYLAPDTPNEPISFGDGAPVGHADGPDLTGDEYQRIMTRLWELSLESWQEGRLLPMTLVLTRSGFDGQQ